MDDVFTVSSGICKGDACSEKGDFLPFRVLPSISMALPYAATLLSSIAAEGDAQYSSISWLFSSSLEDRSPKLSLLLSSLGNSGPCGETGCAAVAAKYNPC